MDSYIAFWNREGRARISINNHNTQDMTLPPFDWERSKLEEKLRRAVHTGENMSRDDLEELVKVFQTLSVALGVIGDEESRRSLLYRALERRENERDAYRHALEAIVRSSRANLPNQPTAENIALEALALPNDELLKARTHWENQIIEASEKVPISVDSHDWVYGPELDHYMEAWSNLQKFHEENSTDKVIGPHIVSEFIAFSRLLRRIISNPQNPEQLRHDAEELADSLDVFAEQAIWAAGAEYW
jgi:hypothetical protein